MRRLFCGYIGFNSLLDYRWGRRHILRRHSQNLAVAGDDDGALLVFFERQHRVISSYKPNLQLLVDVGSLLFSRHDR